MLSQPRPAASTSCCVFVQCFRFSLCSLGQVGNSQLSRTPQSCTRYLVLLQHGRRSGTLVPNPSKNGLRSVKVDSVRVREDGTNCKVHSHASFHLPKRALAAGQLAADGVPLAYPKRRSSGIVVVPPCPSQATNTFSVGGMRRDQRISTRTSNHRFLHKQILGSSPVATTFRGDSPWY